MMAFLLLIRMGLLVVVTAALPIAGAAEGTKIGSQAYENGGLDVGVPAVQTGRIVRDRRQCFSCNPHPRVRTTEARSPPLSERCCCARQHWCCPRLMRLIVPAVGEIGGGGSGAGCGGRSCRGRRARGGMVATGGASGAAGAGAGGDCRRRWGRHGRWWPRTWCCTSQFRHRRR